MSKNAYALIYRAWTDESRYTQLRFTQRLLINIAYKRKILPWILSLFESFHNAELIFEDLSIVLEFKKSHVIIYLKFKRSLFLQNFN